MSLQDNPFFSQLFPKAQPQGKAPVKDQAPAAQPLGTPAQVPLTGTAPMAPQSRMPQIQQAPVAAQAPAALQPIIAPQGQPAQQSAELIPTQAQMQPQEYRRQPRQMSPSEEASQSSPDNRQTYRPYYPMGMNPVPLYDKGGDVEVEKPLSPEEESAAYREEKRPAMPWLTDESRPVMPRLEPELPESPKPNKERFWNKERLLDTAALLGESGADVYTTHEMLKHRGVHEANPLAAPLTSKGLGGQIAAGLIGPAAVVGAEYLAEKTGHPKIAKVIQRVAPIVEGANVVRQFKKLPEWKKLPTYDKGGDVSVEKPLSPEEESAAYREEKIPDMPWLTKDPDVKPHLQATPRSYLDRPNTITGLEKMYSNAASSFMPRQGAQNPEVLVPIDPYGELGETTKGERGHDEHGAMHAKAEIPVDSMAEIHTHPYGIAERPSSDDFKAAKNRPNFVMSQGALWVAPSSENQHPVKVATLHSAKGGHLKIDWEKEQPIITDKTPTYDKGGDVNVNDGKHQLAVLEDGERVLTPKEAEAYRRTHGEKETKMSTRIPKINLYDNGGDVSTDAARRAQAAGDSYLNSFLSAPTEKTAAPAPVLDTTGDEGAFGIAGIRKGLADRAAAKVTTERGDNVMQPSRMPSIGGVAEAAPAMPKIALSESPIKAYDEGGDVEVEDKSKLRPVEQPAEQSRGVLRSDENAQPEMLIPAGVPAEEKEQPTQGHALGQEWLKKMGVKPAETTAPPSVDAALPKIAMPAPAKEMHQETAGGPLISGAASTETPSEQRDLRNMERKAKVAQLEQKRQDALAAGDLTTADRYAVAKSQLEKTPWADRSTLSKFGKIASVAGNIAGDIVNPNVMALIPGTDLNKQLKAKAAFNRIPIESEADLRQAQTDAASVKETTPAQQVYKWAIAQGKTPDEALAMSQGTGKTPEEKFTDWAMNGQKDESGQPYTRLSAHQAWLEQAPDKGNDKPLGVAVPSVNKALTDRYQVLNPGKPLPPEFTLPANATQADFNRVDKLMESTEKATATQTQQQQIRADKEKAAAESKRRYEQTATRKEITAHDRDYIKPAEATELSYGKMNAAYQEYEAAKAQGKDLPTGAQSMLALSTHLATTFGGVKGSRITKDMIQEHLGARGVSDKALVAIQRLSNGDQLSPDQWDAFNGLVSNTRDLTWQTAVRQADRKHIPIDFMPDGLTAVKIPGHPAGVIHTSMLEKFKKANPDAEVLSEKEE